MPSSLQEQLFVPDALAFPACVTRTTHLAIGAHQDDLEIFAYHGIETCFERDDRWFGGVTVTNGSGSARAGPFAHQTDEQMQQLRFAEQNEAARIGRYAFQAQLGFSSASVKEIVWTTTVVEALSEILRLARPETLYLHNPADKHDTHVAVLQRSLEALRRLPPEARPRQVLGCEVWRDLDWLDDETKIALPVGRLPDLERELLKIFRSQVEGGKDYVEATLGRRRANATFLQSHAIDAAQGYTFAMDLTPLANDPSLDLTAFTTIQTKRFQEDVRARLMRWA
jgi:LmbE family N-acetylglucosaminyl deacetylase